MDAAEEVGVAFGKGQDVAFALHDADLLRFVFFLALGHELLDDDDVVMVVLFDFGLMVGVEDVLRGEEVDAEIFAQAFDGGRVLQAIHLNPVDGVVPELRQEGFQAFAAGGCHSVGAVAVEMQVGGSRCAARVFQLFAQEIVLCHG